jgi:hypothetical protein
MNVNNDLLMQYLNSLDESFDELEKAYFKKDVAKTRDIKKFILEIKSKIEFMLK